MGGHRLWLTFADGLCGEVDLADLLVPPNGPMFEPLEDVASFARVAVDPELGTVVWPNGADVAPDVLHQQVLSLT